MLPNFLIVGAAKSGTTSIYEYLNDHPQVYMSPVKEPYFFSFMDKIPDFQGPFDEKTNKEEIITSRSEYEHLYSGVTNEIAIGESSNAYLYLPGTAGNIKKLIPDCKIVIILRDPVSRAFSHFLQHKMLGTEMLDFEEAIEKEEERKKKNWRWHYQYIDQGRYYKQVKRYIDVFGSEQVKVYLFDDLAANPGKMMADLSEFLGIDPKFYDNYDYQRFNKAGLPRNQAIHRLIRHQNPVRKIAHVLVPLFLRERIVSFLEKINYKYDDKPRLNPDTKVKLKKIFKADIIKTGKLIGRDLSMWHSKEQ